MDTIDDYVGLFTPRSQQFAALYRQLKEPVEAPLEHFRETMGKLYNIPENEVCELQTRLEANRHVNNDALIELRDEVRDKFKDCSDKAALEAQLTVRPHRICEGQVARAVGLVGGGSKEVRSFIRGLSRNDLIDLNRVLDLAKHGSITADERGTAFPWEI